VLAVEGQHACKLIGDWWELGIQPLLDDELTTASRQGQKNTASCDQARQSSTGDGAGDSRRCPYDVNGGVRSTGFAGNADDVVLRRHGVRTSAGICEGIQLDTRGGGVERRAAQGSAAKECVRCTDEG
jgi:hypothetical protein